LVYQLVEEFLEFTEEGGQSGGEGIDSKKANKEGNQTEDTTKC
jgi:hypothetical protein